MSAGDPVHQHSAAVAVAGAHRRRHNPHLSATHRLERPQGDCGAGAGAIRTYRPRHRQRRLSDAGLLLHVDDPRADSCRPGEPLCTIALGEDCRTLSTVTSHVSKSHNLNNIVLHAFAIHGRMIGRSSFCVKPFRRPILNHANHGNTRSSRSFQI